MAGGKSTPKKDKMIKISGGEAVKKGQILVRGLSCYKAGVNVKGINTMHAGCDGKVAFAKKKTRLGKLRTFISVIP